MQRYGGNFTDFTHKSLSYLPSYITTITNSDSHRVYLREENLIEGLEIEKEGLLAAVKCSQTNAHASAILPVFSK